MAKKKKMKKPTLAEIKRNTKKDAPYFFDAKTLKFFGQKMSDFKVHQTQSGKVYIYAKSYFTDARTGGKQFMGYTIREYIPKGANSKLKYMSGSTKLVDILNK